MGSTPSACSRRCAGRGSEAPAGARKAPLDGAAARGGAAAVAAHHAEHEQHEHRAEDGADDAAEIELVLIADPEQVGEQHPAHERADDADDDRGAEAHRVVARKQGATQVAGDDADDDCSDDLSEHVTSPLTVGWPPDRGSAANYPV